MCPPPADSTHFPWQHRQRRRNFFQALRQTDPDHPTVVDVGQQLRQLRNQHELSIRQLAEKSGLNVNTLSMIENGKSSPTVATLQQLAFSLEVPITAFFETGEAPSQIAFQKANRRGEIQFAHGLLYDLGAGLVRGGAEPFLIKLEPGADSGPQPIMHTGREFVYCLEGLLGYRIEEQSFSLEPGDSLFFEAHLPHCWQNLGNTHSQSLLILCPSEDEDQATKQHFTPAEEVG